MKRTSYLGQALIALLILSAGTAPRSEAAPPGPQFQGRYAGTATGAAGETPGTILVAVTADEGTMTIELLRADETSSTFFNGTYEVAESRVFMQFAAFLVNGKVLGQIVDKGQRVPFHLAIEAFGTLAVDVSGVLIRE